MKKGSMLKMKRNMLIFEVIRSKGRYFWFTFLCFMMNEEICQSNKFMKGPAPAINALCKGVIWQAMVLQLMET